MAKLYRIANWNKHYEKAQARKVKKPAWVPIPVKHDGNGYRRVISHGADIYGAWCLILEVAAKCEPRGILMGEAGPLEPEDLAMKTGAPLELFERALTVLSNPKIGWLLVVNWEPEADAVGVVWEQVEGELVEAQENVSLQDITGQDTTEHDNKESARFVPPTVAEVREYMHSANLTMDPEAFVDHFKSNGWRVGGRTPMRDWKASVRNWARRDFGAKNATRSRDNSHPRDGGTGGNEDW